MPHLAAADRTVKQRILHKRLAPIAMEPRGVLARYFPGEEELTVWSSTQIPHLMRTQVALMIGYSREQTARDHSRGWRWFRIEVECLRGRGAARMDLDATWQAGQVDRDATRKHAGHDSWTRSGRRHRSCFQERRHLTRSALQRLCRSRCLSSTAHARDSHAHRA